MYFMREIMVIYAQNLNLYPGYNRNPGARTITIWERVNESMKIHTIISPSLIPVIVSLKLLPLHLLIAPLL